jgi:hypothetical protein
LPAFSGLPGQILMQGASEQWLHSTGITECVVLGKVPSVCIRKVGPVEALLVTAVAGVVFGFAGKGTGATAVAFCEVNDHSKSCHDLYSCRVMGDQAFWIRTPVKPPLRAVAPLSRS